jgi:hypothetical protein
MMHPNDTDTGMTWMLVSTHKDITETITTSEELKEKIVIMSGMGIII